MPDFLHKSQQIKDTGQQVPTEILAKFELYIEDAFLSQVSDTGSPVPLVSPLNWASLN